MQAMVKFRGVLIVMVLFGICGCGPIYNPEKIGKTLHFAGYNWLIKYGQSLGPGPNDFSDSKESIWVDEKSRLNLKIARRDGIWYCSEAICEKSLGYGTYVYTIDSRLDTLDRNIVLGLFTWDTYAPKFNHREIDFEFSRWTEPKNKIGQYVIQPWRNPGNIYRFEIDYSNTTQTTTHVMTWAPDSISFQSYYGDYSPTPAKDDIITSWVYTGKDLPPAGGENARINLWLIESKPPHNKKDAHLIIKDFKFLKH